MVEQLVMKPAWLLVLAHLLAEDIPLDHQRPAEKVFEKVVEEQITRLSAEHRLPEKRTSPV